MSFYTDKRVVVTGGAGFLGSHLVDALLEQRARVLVVDNLSHGRYLRPGVEFLKLDIKDGKEPHWQLTHHFWNADMVFNLAAAVAGVQYNQNNHDEMFERNRQIQVGAAVAAEKAQVGRFLQVSSVCVYAPGYNSPCLEMNGHVGEPTGANLGYSNAKRKGEDVLYTLAIPHIVIARPSNLYGPRDYYYPREHAHVIPALIDKVMNDEEVVVNGTGNERREFLYVEDAARGLMHLMEHGKHCEAYNLGTNGTTTISIRSLVDAIQLHAGTDKPVRFTQQFDAGDSARWSNCEKLGALGWHSTTGLDAGLIQTIADYQERATTYKRIYIDTVSKPYDGDGCVYRDTEEYC